MAEKNREIDRLRQQLEDAQNRLEAANEVNRLKDKATPFSLLIFYQARSL
jgi:hypothetical protein